MMFSKNFELVIITGEGPDSYGIEDITEILEYFSNEGIQTSNANVKIKSIGFGADAYGLLIELFKNVPEGVISGLVVTAILGIGKPLKEAISKIKKRWGRALLNERCAREIAYEYAKKNIDGSQSDIQILSSNIYPIPNFALNPQLNNNFSDHPFNYYVFAFNINNEFIILINMTSFGEIICTNKLPLNYLDFHQITLSDFHQTLCPEYDIEELLKSGVKGKRKDRCQEVTNIILLDSDVAEAFPNDKAVNEALRLLLKLTQLPKS